MKLDTDINIRIAIDKDLSAITDIYNQAVKLQSATADTTPVTIENRSIWLEQHSPDIHPVFVALNDGTVVGWCSVSPYRPGRMALRHTAEISYYVDENHRGMGVGTALISHTINSCKGLGIKSLFAIILDINQESSEILKKFGFEKWGHMPNIADFGGNECGHLYYGLRVSP